MRPDRPRRLDESALTLSPSPAVALIIGSVFYQLPATAAGAFRRGGAIFLGVIFNGCVPSRALSSLDPRTDLHLLDPPSPSRPSRSTSRSFQAFTELPSQMQGRPIVWKHKSWALYRPAATTLAATLADLPINCLAIFLFAVVLYWMIGLAASAGAFFSVRPSSSPTSRRPSLTLTASEPAVLPHRPHDLPRDERLVPPLRYPVPQLRPGQPLRVGHRDPLRALLGVPHPGAPSFLSLSLASCRSLTQLHAPQIFAQKRWLFWLSYLSPFQWGYAAALANEVSRSFRPTGLLSFAVPSTDAPYSRHSTSA